MTVALAFETDDGSRAIQAQVEVHEQDGVRPEEMAFEVYYDLARTAEQLMRGAFRNIALQFPDSLLPDAPRVQSELQRRLEGKLERMFVLGDTSYGSCCVDEVAAQHLAADCIVHYGRTCLSATSKVPVIYVFGNAAIDTGACADALAATVRDMSVDQRVILLYEPSYHYASQAIHTALQEQCPAHRVLYGDMATYYDPHHIEGEAAVAGESLDPSTPPTSGETPSADGVIYIGGQRICLTDGHNGESAPPHALTAETCALLYVGVESAHLTSILMRYSDLSCFSYNPETCMVRKEAAMVNRALMRRFYLVQQAKEAQIIGILMGTLGVAKYLDVVHGLQRLIKQSGRKSYLFVVGKVNVPKLANYAEIDAFVLVACQQNSLMDSKEYFKPIVTPYEMQLALSERDEWTGQMKTDFGEVLPLLQATSREFTEKEGRADAGSDDDSDKPFFSLVTGTYTTAGRGKDSARQGQDDETDSTMTALQVKDAHTDLMEYRSEAAEFLAQREYQGLEPRIGETAAHAAVKGSTGIARGYDHEQ